jgi:exosortase
MRVEMHQRWAGAVLIIHAIAFWPVWRWFLARTTDGSDEPWGIVALLVALALSWPSSHRLTLKLEDPLLIAAAGLTFVYVAVFAFTPPLVRAVIAMSALACTWVSLTRCRERLPVVIALFALSLPVIASLQFYAGYPLRSLTAAGATAMLNLFGMMVERSGTAMLWQGRTVLVDAPCSGVRMLWTGAALCCVLASQRNVVTWRGLAAALAMVLPVALFANAIRAALLFILETRSQPMPDFLHASVGVATFILAASLLLASEMWLRKIARAGSDRYNFAHHRLVRPR